VVTGDIINARYSKWIYTVWQEMPLEIRRQVLMVHVEDTPSETLESLSEKFRR
jgi:hypothetical protein